MGQADVVNAATRFQAGDFATPANLLTLSRILLAPPLFVLILERRGHPRRVVGRRSRVGLFVAITDNLDGKLARRHGTTRSGAFLDPLADKIVVLGVMVCLVSVRPLLVAAGRARRGARARDQRVAHLLGAPRPRHPGAHARAKYKTLVQGIALLLAVLPPLEDADAVARHRAVDRGGVHVGQRPAVRDRRQRALSRTGDLKYRQVTEQRGSRHEV